MRKQSRWSFLLLATCIAGLSATTAEAQLLNRIERRAVRNERQLQRQVNRSNYYTNQAWQTLTPWTQRYNVAPVQRAANAVAATANVVGNAVARTAEAVDGDGVRYGYRTNTPANAWFYDYYTYRPTYYYGAADNGRYTTAIRYFDSNNDGIYDSQAVYRDSNDDGRYDQFDRRDFYAQGDSSQPANGDEVVDASDSRNATLDASQDEYLGSLQDARRYRLEGEISVTKSALVNGTEHLIVGLGQSDQKDPQTIDLGPVEDMQNQGVEVGKAISVEGMVEDVGDYQVLIADRVRIENGQTLTVQHNAETNVEGSIVDVQKIQVGDVETLMAIMDVDGQRRLVDLGPAADFPRMPDSNLKVRLSGVPIQSQGHQVLMANQVWLDGNRFEIQRSANR